MQCKERLEAYLRERKVPFQLQHHPAAYSAQHVAAVEHIPGRMMAKVVVVFADEKPVLLALPAPERVDLSKAGVLLGVSEIRLAREDQIAATFPDCEVGAMPPFGNLYGVPVYVERSLADDETIVVQAGTYTDTISLKYADFERLVQPTVAEFAQRGNPPATQPPAVAAEPGDDAGGDVVAEAARESFPASDPPSWAGGRE